MKNKRPNDPVERSIRMYETRIKTTNGKVREIRAEADKEIGRLKARANRFQVLANALKEGHLKQ